MPAKNVEPKMVYLPPETADFFQEVADWEGIPLSAVLRRVLVVEHRRVKDGERRAERKRPRQRRSKR